MFDFKSIVFAVFWIVFLTSGSPKGAVSQLKIGDISQSSEIVPLYEKFEASFDIDGTVAENLQWPYDPDDIAGLTTRTTFACRAGAGTA